MKTIPAKIKTSDGKEWTEEQLDEAEHHQKKLDVGEEFARARSAWARTLAEELTTKDGHRFNFDWWDFYRIREVSHGRPYLEEISLTLSRWTGRFDIGPDEYGAELGKDARLIIRDPSSKYGRDVKISECYRKREAAEAALYEARVRWLHEEREALAEWALKREIITREVEP